MMKQDIPPHQIVAEYDALYRAAPTPITHPQLFDPLNPPPGYLYDAHYCCWYFAPRSGDSILDKAIVWTAFIVSVVMSIWVVFK